MSDQTLLPPLEKTLDNKRKQKTKETTRLTI